MGKGESIMKTTKKLFVAMAFDGLALAAMASNRRNTIEDLNAAAKVAILSQH